MPLPADYTIIDDGFSFRGPAFEKGPLPAIFYLALSAEDSLCLEPFAQPVDILSQLPVRVFSITLPGHESGKDKVKAMDEWALELSEGNNIIEKFVQTAIKKINFLFEKGYIADQKLGFMGLSRGGFAALHVAAQDPRVKAVCAFAPLIELYALDEFKQRPSQLANDLSLDFKLESLCKRPIRFYIGNRDERVGTMNAFHYIYQLAEMAYASGTRSPPSELIISPSTGFKGHGTLPPTFQHGANWMKITLGR